MKSITLTKGYKAWQATATPEQVAFVDEVFHLCEENYEAGGDIVVECLDPDFILAHFQTVADVKAYVSLHYEAAMNARWGEDSDPEVNRPAWRDA